LVEIEEKVFGGEQNVFFSTSAPLLCLIFRLKKLSCN